MIADLTALAFANLGFEGDDGFAFGTFDDDFSGKFDLFVVGDLHEALFVALIFDFAIVHIDDGIGFDGEDVVYTMFDEHDGDAFLGEAFEKLQCFCCGGGV